MTSLVLLAVLLHAFGLRVESLSDVSIQLMVLGRGEFLGALFAALLGAISVTGEIRHGTIRSTFLFTPVRNRVIWSKVLVSGAIGVGFGLAAGTIGAVAGTAALKARGIDLLLDGSNDALLIAGASAAGGLWAAIGVGIGAIVRNQVPTLIGICAWLLFVEGVLAGDVGVLGDIGRLLPGSAASAISGQDPGTLLAPEVGLAVLALYAFALALAGAVTISRRDVG